MKWNLLVSHKIPIKPGRQEHEDVVISSTHVAPFRQGLVAHGLGPRKTEITHIEGKSAFAKY